MFKLTERQSQILDFIRKKGKTGNKEIKEYLKTVSRITVFRDIEALLQNSLIIKRGKGRSVFYEEGIMNDYLRYVDVERYFEKDVDERTIKEHFNFEIFKAIGEVFTKKELEELRKINEEYLKRRAKLSETALKKEIERLTIELSWKSAKMEGNTYSLIDTEILIKEHQEAEGHKKEEAIMILNHKKALDYIFSSIKSFKSLTVAKIESLHDLLIKDLKVESGIRKRQAGIIGTSYRPLDNQHQIREVLEKTVKLINFSKEPFFKAVMAMLLIAYIQPFADGNKRTSRILGNAILLAYDLCPLSFRSINEADYKKAVILFYEQNNLRFFKELFIEQFKFAGKNYF